MNVRLAMGADAQTIVALNAEVQRLHADALPQLFKQPGSEALSSASVVEILADAANRIFIADEDGEPAGYVYAQVVRRPETALRCALDLVYIHHIAVRQACRRRGCGEALMRRVRALAREEGIARVELDVWSFNAGARAFFRKQGFAVFNERMCIEAP